MLAERSVNLVGSETSDGSRTTFTGTVQAAAQRGYICQFDGLTFAGAGQGVGVSASARINFTGCRFTGWRTGVLVQDGWVSAFDCTFADNEIGLHLNIDAGNPMDSRCMGDTFRSNGTAVLLERVSNMDPLPFPEAVFSGNGTDIDNRCEQKLDTSEAVFE